MIGTTLRVAGIELVATLAGALYWPAAASLIVADLHLEKGSAFARRGVPLPPYDSRATLARLAAVVAALQPARVICLGDSFHDRAGPARLSREDAALLRRLCASCDWIWIAGNHDGKAATPFGGTTHDVLTLTPFVFRHAPVAVPVGEPEIAGHLHPKASVSTAAGRLSARCFASDGERLLLPAFGAYAGGLDVLHPAVAGLFRPGFNAYLLGRIRLHAIPSTRLSRAGPPRAAAR
jgi:DNA ligase-associated metallophosphoesterase